MHTVYSYLFKNSIVLKTKKLLFVLFQIKFLAQVDLEHGEWQFLSFMMATHETFWFITSRIRRIREGNIFSLFRWGGVPHLCPIILPLVIWSSWGTPSPSHNTSTGVMLLQPWQGWDTPHPGETRVPPSRRDGYSPQIQERMGYLPPICVRTSWRTPLSKTGQDGVPPPPPGWDRERWGAHPTPQYRLCLDRLRRGRYASCSFPQEDFLVLFYHALRY